MHYFSLGDYTYIVINNDIPTEFVYIPHKKGADDICRMHIKVTTCMHNEGKVWSSSHVLSSIIMDHPSHSRFIPVFISLVINP